MLLKPSKKVLFSAVFLSLILHAFVCKIPVQSAIPEEETYQKLNISLLSLAAPAVLAEEKVVEKTKKAPAPEKKLVEQVEEAPAIEQKEESVEPEDKPEQEVKKNTKEEEKASPQKQLTSNNNGSQRSTVMPVLNASDFVQTVAPVYPRAAISRGIEGNVLVKVMIGSSGKAEMVRVENSSGFEMLDNSAIKAVSKWKFNSLALAKSSKNWVLVPVKFMIQ